MVNFREKNMVLTDKLVGKFNSAVNRIYFHPDCEITVSTRKLIIVIIGNLKLFIH